MLFHHGFDFTYKNVFFSSSCFFLTYSDGVQCFDASQAELNYYRHPGQAMLAPPGFPPLHYLNKPLPGLSMEQAQQALEQYSAQGMPDLLPHNMHQTSPSPGSIKSKGSDLRLFKCLTCNKDFKQKSTLLQHERIHTDSRPYGCPECLKRFRQQSHLTQHLRIHANEKPYTCAYCPRSFRQRAILNQHLRIHSGEKPFTCDQCSRSFRQKAILNQHVRTHSGKSFYLLLNHIGTKKALISFRMYIKHGIVTVLYSALPQQSDTWKLTTKNRTVSEYFVAYFCYCFASKVKCIEVRE